MAPAGRSCCIPSDSHQSMGPGTYVGFSKELDQFDDPIRGSSYDLQVGIDLATGNPQRSHGDSRW